MSFNTAFLLMAQYKAIIPLDAVRRDFFSYLTLPKFLRKLSSGDIALPLMRIERSQECAKGIHLQDLADYLDTRGQPAQKEFAQMSGWKVQVQRRRGVRFAPHSGHSRRLVNHPKAASFALFAFPRWR
ncbi:pyocin activator PrtN family protein, partial [Devosia sp.]|uniref:pyocin activator PrtN family protein n=1 Tax=Devosia sp. TaxID=1871048 RepID=UPI0035250185